MTASAYMDRTAQLSTRVDSKTLELFKHIIYEKTGMQKGDLQKGIEDAMLLYIQKHVADQMALPIAELCRRISIDKAFAEFIDKTGMTVYDLVMTGVSIYMQMPESARQKIRQMQIESNLPVDQAVQQSLNTSRG